MDPQSVRDILKWQPSYPPALVGRGVLYHQGRGIIYGKYKSLKSMLAMNLGLCVADGREWIGFSTPSGGAKVLYLQIEMPHMFMKKRLDAMLREWPGERKEADKWDGVQDGLMVWSEPFIKLDTPEGSAVLHKHLAKLKPDLLIVDPLYKVMSGNILDPNSVRAFLDNLDKTIANMGCGIVLVHHTRKGLDDSEWGSDDMLGSIFLSAWADSVIKVTRKEIKLAQPNIIPMSVNFDVLRHAEDPIEEMEVTFDSKSLVFKPVETGIFIQV